jgi:hypothetical protein
VGTNYYAILTEKEINEKKIKLMQRVIDLDLSHKGMLNGFTWYRSKDDYDTVDPWSEFLEDVKIHIGKSSGGWKFIFNKNRWRFYSDIKSLKQFMKKRVIVDEYSRIVSFDEFWKMVEEKQLNGTDSKTYYESKKGENVSAVYKESMRENGYYEDKIEGYIFSHSDDFC